MNKKKILDSSILYKRPISKAKSPYNSIIPNTTTNKKVISINFTDDEHYSNNNIISSVRSDINKNKNFSNFNNFKKININYPQCNSSRFTVNNIINKNKFKKNIININNNTLYYNDKDNENKIFQNYNNNTCNISLNQHFYNIDYNTNPNLKTNDTETRVEKNKLDKFKETGYKNINNNKSKDKPFPYFYLNTLTNSAPYYFNKDTNNSNMDIDNNSNSMLFNNIIPKINKKANKINLIKVNSKNKFLNMTNNNTNLHKYTNFVKILNKKNINNNNMHKNKSTSINSFKYKKKIITYNSFVKKKEQNDSINSNSNMFKNNNYSNNYISINKSLENNNDKGIKSSRVKGEINKGVNNYFLNKMFAINNKKILDLNNVNNLNKKDNNNRNNYHTTKHINLNQKINYYLNPKDINKHNESNYSLDKSPGNSSLPIINYSFNNFNNIINSKKKNNLKMLGIYSNNTLTNERTEKFSSNSLFNLNNTYNNKKSITLKKDNSSIEDNDKFNISKSKKNIDNDIIGYEKKSISSLIKNKNKINFYHTNNHVNIIKSKIPILLSKEPKEISNLKNNFFNHFSLEENNGDNNDVSLREKKMNGKNKNNMNFKQKKKGKIENSNENSTLVNNSLNELISKFRQTKKNVVKGIKFNDKKLINKKSILNKEYNYIMNQSKSLNSLKINTNFNKIYINHINIDKSKQKKENDNTPSTPSTSTFSTKNKGNNEFMEQSLKLSKFIKNYYLKNYSYPQTNLNFYRIGRIIGQGGFAKVNLGLNVLTGRVVAIKSFNKTIKTKYGDNLNMDKILYEINLMRKLNHPNITKILETFEDEKFYFIIMEYINGGNLFSYVKKRRKLSEKVAKFLFKQIILGIKHIHSQLIVHRDIKLENILIDMNNNVKICDFGIGIILSSEYQVLHSHCGTPLYIAPEIILSNKKDGYKGFPVDIWSAGIALYIMLSGKLPFNLDEDQDDIDVYNNNVKEKNIKLKYEIVNKEPKYIDNISDEARNLLHGLLNKNPEKRLTCDEILNHPWLSDIKKNKNHLFSKAEKDTLSKTYIDYRKSKLDDLVENFTLSNLFNDKKNTDIEYNNVETKSSLLAPFNSLNYEFFNISKENLTINSKKDNFDDCYNKKLCIEKDLLSFSNKAKELNLQYELNNNKEVDNGVLINSKSIENSNSSSQSNPSTYRNSEKYFEYEYSYDEIDNMNDEKLDRILSQMELMGYERNYIIKSIKNNYLNHAATVFFLLMKYENI